MAEIKKTEISWNDIIPKELSERRKPRVIDSEGRIRPEGYKDGPRPTSDASDNNQKLQSPKESKPQADDKKVRPAKDITKGGARSKFLGGAKDVAARSSAGFSVAKGIIKKMPVVGTAAGFIADASPLNTGEREFLADVKRKAGKGYGDKPVGPFKPSDSRSFSKKSETKNWDKSYRNLGAINGKVPVAATPDQRKKLDEMYRSSKARVSESSKLERLRATRAALGKESKGGAPKGSTDATPPKPKLKPERNAVGVASDKSRLAPKMTNFQRMKARQFEKEGVAGRSMTAAQAKRKATEKGSSIADLRKLFGLSRVQKAAPGKKSLSSEFAKKNLAANQKIGKSR